MVQIAKAFAPATLGNVAVGFDVLGQAIEGIGDYVTIRRVPEHGVTIESISGCAASLPTDPEKNTATAGLLRLLEDLDLRWGMAVRIEKGIDLGSGMGGSAASAVASIVAANALLDEPLDDAQLFNYALLGEEVASGAAHGDNVAPCLWGGLILLARHKPLHWVRIPMPDSLRVVLVHPQISIATRDARAVLPSEIGLSQAVEQIGFMGGLVAGCFRGDLGLIRASLRDVLIEPRRASLIPGFSQVKKAALEAEALGCSISGAGPSVFAWCEASKADSVRRAMISAFRSHHIEAQGWICSGAAPGARVVA